MCGRTCRCSCLFPQLTTDFTRSYRFNTNINVSLTTTHIFGPNAVHAEEEVNVTARCTAQWPNGTLPRGAGWQCPYDINEMYDRYEATMGQFYFWLEPREGGSRIQTLNREELWYALRIVRNGTEARSG